MVELDATRFEGAGLDVIVWTLLLKEEWESRVEVEGGSRMASAKSEFHANDTKTCDFNGVILTKLRPRTVSHNRPKYIVEDLSSEPACSFALQRHLQRRATLRHIDKFVNKIYRSQTQFKHVFRQATWTSRIVLRHELEMRSNHASPGLVLVYHASFLTRRLILDPDSMIDKIRMRIPNERSQ